MGLCRSAYGCWQQDVLGVGSLHSMECDGEGAELVVWRGVVSPVCCTTRELDMNPACCLLCGRS